MSGRSAIAVALLALTSCQAAPAGPPAPEPWIELFDGHSLGKFVASQFGGDGSIRVRDGAIVLDIGSPLTGVTWTGALPTGDYEIEVTAARLEGDDFFCGLTFPVRDAHLTLVLGGWGGAVSGLSSLDGMDAARNDTRTLHHFVNDRDYVARIRVTTAAVAVLLDGKPFLEQKLQGFALSLRPEVELSRPLGIAAFASKAAIRAVRWRRAAALLLTP